MPEKKIIAVVGATGAQGGGLVRAIMNGENNDFTARALTRNVNSDKATELAKLGAEVVAADVDNLESLTKAFQGCLRGVLRHILLGAFFSREGICPGPGHGHGSEGRWPRTRHLVHLRRYP